MAGSPLTPADLDLHRRLGIPPDLLERAGVRRVTDREAREQLGVNRTGDLAGVLYPRLHPETGQARGYRLRRDHPEVENGKPRDKYLSSVDRPTLFFAPGAGPLLTDLNIPIVMVEADKSSLALTAVADRSCRSLLVIATGGDWGWRGRIGKVTTADGTRADEKGVLPDLDRISWHGRDAVILFDAIPAHNSAVRAARRAFTAELVHRGARVRVADLPVEPGVNGPDDYVALHGDAAILALIDGARPAQPESAADVLRLAGLDQVQGLDHAELEERLRRLRDALHGADAIRRRTVRELVVATLKAEKISGAAALVDAAIGREDADAADDPAADFLADDEPWPEPVDGAVLLTDLVAAVMKYVVLSRAAAIAIVLWIVLTYCADVVNLLPLLLVTSPTKRCGKTKCVEVVGGLACRALPVSNITAAALYRAIDRFRPTLLLDESDTFINDDRDLRGVINAGHTRHTARVIRCVGDNSEPTIFSTWCPKLVAMIGLPKDTLIDRSIIIRLERKGAADTVARLRAEQVHQVFADFRRQIRRWANDHLDEVRAADPVMPPGLHDRAEDNSRPLVAIADLAGSAWPTDARQAIVELTGHDADDDPIAEQLLADLRLIFDDPDTPFHTMGAITTAKVTELLAALDSKPWATFNKAGKPISQHQIAKLLKRFSVRSIKVKGAGKAANCYRRVDLDPVWMRYCPGVQVGTAEPTNDSGPESPIAGRNPFPNGSDLKPAVSSMNTGTVPGFRVETPGGRERVEI